MKTLIRFSIVWHKKLFVVMTKFFSRSEIFSRHNVFFRFPTIWPTKLAVNIEDTNNSETDEEDEEDLVELLYSRL